MQKLKNLKSFKQSLILDQVKLDHILAIKQVWYQDNIYRIVFENGFQLKGTYLQIVSLLNK